MLSKRVVDMRSSTDVSVNQTRSVLLNILNDYTGVVIFTTNFIQNFDPAFLRRIKYHIRFRYPNEELRNRLWQMYIPKALPIDFDIHDLSHQIQDISASDISNAVFNVAVSAARNNKSILTYKDFEKAIELIIQAKKENSDDSGYAFQRRRVSEQYVNNIMGKSRLEE